MSHVHEGPLATYNSLTDPNLSGYFGNTRMRRHLRKSGLVNRRGEIMSENQYQLHMARKEHKKQVKDMLAQAIIHKTLDLERYRQVEIKKKLEEIAKIEMVRRVRASRGRKGDEDVLPYLTPRSQSRPQSERPSESSSHKRPKSAPAPPKRRQNGKMGYTDPYEEVIYVDEDGRPVSPPPPSDRQSYRDSMRELRSDNIDTRHLYALDSEALQQYALKLSKSEKGRDGSSSPYMISQIPVPPKHERTRSARSSPRRSARMSARPDPGKRTGGMKGTLLLHRQEPAMMHQGEVQTLCEIKMKYHGPNLTLPRDQFDPTQEVQIDQQHCGGNTLTVFKERIQAGSSFSFISRRHRGYPFGLTLYIDGRVDCRISTCCEYKHAVGVKLVGKMGHFSLIGITGATPCYKCKLSCQAPPRSLKIPKKGSRSKKRTPQQQAQEEVTTEETSEQKSGEPEISGKSDEDNYDDDFEEELSKDKYDDDFDPEPEPEPVKENRHIIGLRDTEERIDGKTVPVDVAAKEKEEEEKVEDMPPHRRIEGYSSEDEDIRGEEPDHVDVRDTNFQRIHHSPRSSSSSSSSSSSRSSSSSSEREVTPRKVKTPSPEPKKEEISIAPSSPAKRVVEVETARSEGTVNPVSARSVGSTTSGDLTTETESTIEPTPRPPPGPKPTRSRRSSSSSSSSSLTTTTEDSKYDRKVIRQKEEEERKNREEEERKQREEEDKRKEAERVERERLEREERWQKEEEKTSRPGIIRQESELRMKQMEEDRKKRLAEERQKDEQRRKEKEEEDRLREEEKARIQREYERQLQEIKDRRESETTSSGSISQRSNQPVTVEKATSEKSSRTSSESESEEDENKFKAQAAAISKQVTVESSNPEPKSGQDAKAPTSQTSSSETEKPSSDDAKPTTAPATATVIKKKPSSRSSSGSSSSSSSSSDSEDKAPKKTMTAPVTKTQGLGSQESSTASESEPEKDQSKGGVRTMQSIEEKGESRASSRRSSQTSSSSSESSDSGSHVISPEKRPESRVSRQSSRSSRTSSESESDEDNQKAVVKEMKTVAPPPQPVTTPAQKSSSSSSGSSSTDTDDDKQKRVVTKSGTISLHQPVVAGNEAEARKSSSSSSGSSTSGSSSSDDEEPTKPPVTMATKTPVTMTTKAEEEKRKSPSPPPAVKQPSKPADSSSSSSDSSDSEDEGEKKKPAETSAHTEDSDPDSMLSMASDSSPSSSDDEDGKKKSGGKAVNNESEPDGGNDPDNVAKSQVTTDTSHSKTTTKQYIHYGSIVPFIEGETTIEFNAMKLDESQLTELGNHIAGSSKIKSVTLTNAGLDDAMFSTLAMSLQMSESRPTFLNFSRNQLGAQSIKSLSTVVKTKPSVETIILSGNPIGDVGLKFLLDALTKTKDPFPFLRKSSGYLTPSEARQQEDKGNTVDYNEPEDDGCNIKELHFDDTAISNVGILEISHFLEFNKTLVNLNLNGNTDVSLNCWEQFGYALKSNTTLQTLSLDYTNIGDKGLEHLAKGLKVNTGLVNLELENAGLTEVGGQVLLDMVRCNRGIISVSMVKGNNISSGCVDEIRKQVASNKATK